MEFTLKFKLLVLGMVVFVSTFIFALLVNTYVLRSRAGTTSMPVRITENSGSIAGTKDVSVSLSAPGKISAFTLVFKTTGNVRVQDSKDPSILGGNTPSGFFSPLTKSTEKVSYGILKDDASLPTGVLVPVTLSCNAVGQGTFTVAAVGSQAVGPGQVEYTFDPIDLGTYTCSSVGSTTPPSGGRTSTGIRAHFSPESGRMAVGGQISTNLLVDGFATGQQVSAIDVKMHVDDGVDVTSATSGSPSTPPAGGSITPPTSTDGSTSKPDEDSPKPDEDSPKPTGGTTTDTRPLAGDELTVAGCTVTVNTWDTTTRVLHIAQLCTGTTLMDSVLLPITLKGTRNATGKIDITNLDVVGPSSPSGYSVAKESFSFQVGEGGAPGTGGTSETVQVSLTLRLQGIQAKPRQTDGLQFKVGAINSSMESPKYQNAAFTSDANGLYHGSVALAVPAGSGYCLLVKGPYHLQKKVCDTAPSETSPGTYVGAKGTITLRGGENSFDFSKIYMMSCDLPAQDGICNSADMSLIRRNLGLSTLESNIASDINQDGITNAQDHALAISSLSIKNDEK